MSYSLSFSKSLIIVVFVASKIEQKAFEFISTQQIADKLNIPPSTSSVILRRLKKAGLIEAREGVNGGVRLAKLPEQITVLDIFDAVEQCRPVGRLSGESRDIDNSADTVVAAPVQAEAVSVEECVPLCRLASRAGVARATFDEHVAAAIDIVCEQRVIHCVAGQQNRRVSCQAAGRRRRLGHRKAQAGEYRMVTGAGEPEIARQYQHIAGSGTAREPINGVLGELNIVGCVDRAVGKHPFVI